ncbi:hypothetical protein BJY52DRAFT_1165977 [Lactarius psammicola]|nr:hypothetical protein BJY52DRAFT_1165977 [Lactarius psammicola]
MRLALSFAIVTAVAHSLTAFGALYVVNPTTRTVCHGGKPCLVQWLDDGQNPLLTTMGPCHVALYSGNEKLIQQIEPVDVSTSHSLTFTPSSNAGPNSTTYYVQFTSTTPSNSSQSLLAFSPNFSLDRMTGSFNSPVPELTSTIPVPSSVLSAHSNQISTSLFGTISSTSTSISSPTRPPASSSTPSSSGPSPSSTSPPASTATSASANAATQHFSQLWVVTLAGLPFLFLV